MRVVGKGPKPCDWCLIGEKPGIDEAKKGIPFVGKTGRELERWFNDSDLPAMKDVFRTNLYREFVSKDYEYTADDFASDEPELLKEIAEVSPKIIVSIGRESTRYFLGDVSMDETHGLGWYLPPECAAARVLELKGDPSTSAEWPVVFVAYHPAAGFRSPELSALVSYDFDSLIAFAEAHLNGRSPARVLHADPIPSPQYFHVTKTSVIDTFKLLAPKKLYTDSEGFPWDTWSVQWAAKAGTGYMALTEDMEVMNAFLEWVVKQRPELVFHSSLHDRGILRAIARACGWSEKRILFEIDTLPFGDTLVYAYLLQLEPQGLKMLATRHANMQMMSFDEMMGDSQMQIALEWLTTAWESEQSDYEDAQQTEFEVINSTPLLDKNGKPRKTKDGKVRYRQTRVLPKLPKSAFFKALERCLRAKDPFKLWNDQTEDVRDAGYRLLGDMPHARYTDVGKFEDFKYYACRDSDATARVEPELSRRVDALGLRDVYNLELSTYPLIDRMMQVGLKPDLAVFETLSENLAWEIADLKIQLEELTGREDFNANSGDQVADYLFHDVGLEPIKVTQGGKNQEPRESTNDKILEALEKEHGIEVPAISLIREYRETYKLKNTFVDRIPDFVNRWPYDGRVHATFRTTRVITGRLAASDPNVLAQPEHGKFTKAFKAGWVAEEGHYIGNWDLSQVELRVLAHLSGDPVLMEAYLYQCPHKKDWQNGATICKRDECVLKGDLHSRLAHMVFGLKPSNQDKNKHRLPAKTHNFGLAMGMTCHGLMIELRKNGIEVDEDGAQEWIDASNKLYAKVPTYKDEKIAEARRMGYVRCLSGRIRYIGGIRSKDERLRAEAERFAFSTPIQEGAQRSMKQAEAYIWTNVLMPYYRDGFYKGGPKGRYVEPLVQVHDALRIEFPIGMERDLNTKMFHAMTKVPTPLRVPLGAEGEFGINMRDMTRF